MSILKVNELRPQSGSNVTIQSGYTLRLGSKNLDSSSAVSYTHLTLPTSDIV